ncbi:hypothetical protein N7513_003265 [Penicillium frequentans]|nr:hypothetical protein N7513_003265 [Penicillium glabrum]
MACEIYVSEEANNRSPQLVPQKINYAVEDELPPFASDNKCDKECMTVPTDSQLERCCGDGALTRIMGLDNLEVATRAEQHPLDWSPKQNKTQDLDRIPKDLRSPVFKFKSMPATCPRIVTPILKKEYKEGSLRPLWRTLPPARPLPRSQIKLFPAASSSPSLAAISTDPPTNLVPHGIISTAERLSSDSKRPDLKTCISLLSLQSLAPLDTGSNTKSLPSIHSALGLSPPEFSSAQISGLPSPLFATSRSKNPHERQLPSLLPQAPPSLPSYRSPISIKVKSTNASPVSQPSFWRTPTSAVSIELQRPLPPPSDPNHHASSTTAKTPATSYPTSTEPVAPAARQWTPFSLHPSPQDGSAISNIGSYKCTYPGCAAAPFQTQYLLKNSSHANVHSSNRPYFCPVEGCPRSVGGNGFKRRNEMMRHDLVHNSPGYVCPFCPDQHKYPRPDNLQRHVRVHHVDKSKDDPILRQVLAQKPTGRKQGRRKRPNG